MNCKFIKKDNTKCNARAIKGLDYCFFHSEKHKEARNEAVIRGGKSLKKNYGSTEAIKLESDEDLVDLLVTTINDLRQNKISTKTANAICYIAMQVFPIAKELTERKKEAEDRKRHPEEYDDLGMPINLFRKVGE